MIHAIGVVLIAGVIARFRGDFAAQRFTVLTDNVGAVILIVSVALSLVVLHAIECVTWAVAYVQLHALPTPADALLYSVDSMTTRGASGLILERQWRMMGASEAGDGMLLFGVSTAFLFYLMQRIWRTESRDR